MADRKDLRESLASQRQQILEAPLRRIDFQNDTLDARRNDNGFAAAYMSQGRNTITVNIREGVDNSFNQTKATKAHEQKHRDNNSAGFNDLSMSLEQKYKTCCIDEISANICELLQWREEYLNAKNDAERKAIAENPNTTKFSYYFDAVRSGKINPFSTNPADFENEMRFIGQETQKMWMRDYTPGYDKSQITPNTLSHFRTHDYKDLAPNEENYQKARQIALGNIGGIDFTQYMDDIECINPNIKKADKMIAEEKPRSDIQGIIKPLVYDFDKIISLEQFAQIRALQHFQPEIRELESVRQAYLDAKTPQEREITASEYSLAAQWLNAVNKGDIVPETPMTDKEKDFMGRSIARECPRFCFKDMDTIKDYYNNVGTKNIAEAINSGQTDINFKKKTEEFFTVCGVDFSDYAKMPVSTEPHIALLDEKIKSGQAIDINSDFCSFDEEKEILKPKLTLNPDLSPAQQFRITQHQMFMENAVARFPLAKTFDSENLKTLTNADESAQYMINDFKKQLDENPKLKEEWEKIEAELAQEIAEAHRGEHFIASGDDKAYKQELQKAYTINGVDWSQIYGKDFDAETLIAEKKPESISEVENSSFFTRLKNKTVQIANGIGNGVKSGFTEFKNKTSQIAESIGNGVESCLDKVKNIFKKDSKKDVSPDGVSGRKTDYRKKTSTWQPYTREPKYDTEWSPERRVSEIMYDDIYDFTKPFLRERLEALQEKAAAERVQTASLQTKSTISANKFDNRVNQAGNNAAVSQTSRTSSALREENRTNTTGVIGRAIENER